MESVHRHRKQHPDGQYLLLREVSEAVESHVALHLGETALDHDRAVQPHLDAPVRPEPLVAALVVLPVLHDDGELLVLLPARLHALPAKRTCDASPPACIVS